MAPNMRGNKGFTLIELSIVLVVVGIMLYMGLSVGSIQLEAAKVKQTKDKLDKIEKAVQLYYETNGRLPCPANGTLAVTDGSFGKGATAGDDPADSTLDSATCPNAHVLGASSEGYMGVVPTRDLDLPDDFMYDGWDDRIAYAVSKHCVDKNNWSDTQKYRCTTGADAADGSDFDGNGDTNFEPGGSLLVKDTGSGATRTAIAVYVLVSYGKDTYGAFPDVGGARINTAISSSTYQDKNAKINAASDVYTNATYFEFYDGPTADYDGVTNYFDDLVRWKTGPQIGYEKDN